MVVGVLAAERVALGVMDNDAVLVGVAGADAVMVGVTGSDLVAVGVAAGVPGCDAVTEVDGVLDTEPVADNTAGPVPARIHNLLWRAAAAG